MARKLPSWTRDFETLIRSIGESKSKAEEDSIIYREIEVLKPRLKDAKLDKRLLKETLIRLMYVEMLGHDASWGHVKALQACSDQNLLTKKVAYLASSLFLDSNSNLIVLVVNTMLQDLQSENYLTVCTALTAACKLIGVDLVNALLPAVLGLLGHPKELVRKKAVMVLHQFLRLDPDQTGPLHDIDLGRHFRTALCDKDPSVMAASLCAIQEAASRNPRAYKSLIPSFASILKQVTEKRLPKAFDYHNVSAPFIQIKLLNILGLVGVGDKAASENMYNVISDSMRRANASHTIGNAIIIECIRTITAIYPQPSLLQAAAEQIAIFLKSSNYNFKYMGIEALSRVVRINATYANEHQLAVIDCLEDPDETLKGKTLELLFKMTNPNNIEVIVDKMIEYLRGTTDDVRKADAVKRIAELAERCAPDPQWYIETMNQIFEIGGEVVDPSLADNLIALIGEGSGQDDEIADSEMRSQAVTSYLALLEKPQLPDILLQVICWVLGEYGTTCGLSAGEIIDRLSAIVETQSVSDLVRGYMLAAFAKLVAHHGVPLTSAAREIQDSALSSFNPDIQQRALELEALIRLPQDSQRAILPPDASAEDIEIDPELSFLSSFVQTALQNGAAPYITEEDRFEMGAVRPSHKDTAQDQSTSQGLRFTAYERQSAPEPVSVRTVSREASPVRGVTETSTGAFDGNSSAKPASSEPQLAVPTSSRQRWGPATFPPPAPAAVQTVSQVAPTTARSNTGSAVQSSRGETSSRSKAEPEIIPSGKAKLAGLLFGSSNSQARSARTRPTQKQVSPSGGKSQSARTQPVAQPNLLVDFGEEESSSLSPQPPSTSQNAPADDPFAMLEGLQHPSQSAAAPTAASQQLPQKVPGLDLDALYASSDSHRGAQSSKTPPSQPEADPFGLGGLTGGTGAAGGLSMGQNPSPSQDPFGLEGLTPPLASSGRAGSQSGSLSGGMGGGNGSMGFGMNAAPANRQSQPALGMSFGGQKPAGKGPMAARGTAAVEKPKQSKDPFADLFS